MRRFYLAVLVPMLLMGAVTVLPATGAGSSSTGVYVGPGYVAEHDAFAKSVPASVPYAFDFIDGNNGWEQMLNPWALDSWAPWVKSSPGRRLVLSVPMLPASAKGQMAAGAAGSFDAHFTQLARDMVSRGLGASIVRIGWEANGTWFIWSAVPDPAVWKAFFRRIVLAMRAVPGAAFSFDWAANPGTSLAFADFYPGDDVVDIVGLDTYNTKWGDSTSTPEQRWNFQLNQFNGLVAHRDFANAHGKPLSFPEWGLYPKGDEQGGGGDDPYYIDRMADWIASNNVAYQSYFDWWIYSLSNFPNGWARYQARFGSTATTTTSQSTSTTVGTTTTVAEKRNCGRRACR